MHVPVLLEEVLKFLDAKSGSTFIDGTVGAGGYIEGILRENITAKILGIDLDRVSLEKVKERFAQRNLSQNVILVNNSYANMAKVAQENNFVKVSGIVLDLGFSSDQVDDAERGFSFQTNGPLDMRYDLNQKLTAHEVVNNYPETKLTQILNEYGEERLSKKIAREIVEHRLNNPINDTHHLFRVIEESLPKPVKHKARDYARRAFQAIRIEVNGELNSLAEVLPKAFELLEPKGRLVIVSFHSLEDRIVKRFMTEISRGCTCPPEFPTCICGKNPQAKVLTRKPVTATDEELERNVRSKPAKLRALVKV